MMKFSSSALCFFVSVFFLQFAQAADKHQLALNWKPEPQFGGFYAAQAGGHYKKNGLDIEVLQGGAGTPVVQMVASKQVPFGIASADEVLIARSRGIDVVAVFAAYQTNPQGIMVHEASGFKSIADVYKSGGTLAIQKGLPYAMFLENKFGKKNIKTKVVPYLGGVQNFLADPKFSQQCFVTSEPIAAKKQGAKVVSFLVASEGYNPYTTVLITHGEVLKSQPELVKKLVASVKAGWREYLDKPEATNKLMGELNKSMDPTTFVESAEAQKPLIETEETAKSGLGVMTEQRWAELARQLEEMKVIKKKVDPKSAFAIL